MSEAHAGVIGGHCAGTTTVHKILQAGIWWPTIHMDTKSFCKRCDICQMIGKPSCHDKMLLASQITLQVFDKWVIYFVGLIRPPGKRNGMHYIITATDYLTRWVEAMPVKDCIAATTMKFLFENVVTTFDC